MSYCSRVYRQRNPHIHDEAAKEPFFAKQNDTNKTGQKTAFFQAKLSVNEPGDQYEREADDIANAVVNQPSKTPLVQQKEVHPEKGKRKEIQKKDIPVSEEEKKKKVPSVQMKQEGHTNTASAQVSSQIENSSGKGNPLPLKTMNEMNSSFGVDFSLVRVHKDREAINMNKELQAHAFTHGSDIYFNDGKFNPENSEGKFLLAHELTHVIQQNSSIQTKKIQRKIGDGHDLNSKEFSGDLELEAAFDGELVLKKGREGSGVKKIQTALIELGFQLPQFGIDGKYGDETSEAVKKYQGSKKLKPDEIDGRVGKQTIALLDSDLPQKKTEDKNTSNVPTAETVDTQKQGELDENGNIKQKPEIKEKPVDKKEIPVIFVKPDDQERLFSFTFEVDAKNDWLLRHKEPFKLSFCDSAVIQLGGKINVGIKMDKDGKFVALSEPELDVNLTPAFCSSNPGVTAQINLLKFTILKKILETDLVGIFGLPDGWDTGLGTVPISGGFQGKAQWTPCGAGDSFAKNVKIGIFLQITGQQGVPDQTNGWRVGGGLFLGHDFDFGPKN